MLSMAEEIRLKRDYKIDISSKKKKNPCILMYNKIFQKNNIAQQ